MARRYKFNLSPMSMLRRWLTFFKVTKTKREFIKNGWIYRFLIYNNDSAHKNLETYSFQGNETKVKVTETKMCILASSLNFKRMSLKTQYLQHQCSKQTIKLCTFSRSWEQMLRSYRDEKCQGHRDESVKFCVVR